MLDVEIPKQPVRDYMHLAGPELLDEIQKHAAALQGLRVLHVSADPPEGQSAESLRALVRLMNDVGLRAGWRVLEGPEELRTAARRLKGALCGEGAALSNEESVAFERWGASNGHAGDGGWDVVVLHGPETLGVRRAASRGAGYWIWSCGLAIDVENTSALGTASTWIRDYDLTVWRSAAETPAALNLQNVAVIGPAIDPLSHRNMTLPGDEVRRICEFYGIDRRRPLIAQLSRLDAANEPIIAIDAFRLVKSSQPGIQLVLVDPSEPEDIPWEHFHATYRYADGDPEIKILNQLNNVGPVELSAFCASADVVIQPAASAGIRDAINEAMWKGRPVVASAVPGVRSQMDHDVSGLLFNTQSKAADECMRVIGNTELARRLGCAARDQIRRNCLVTGMLLDWLRLLNDHFPAGGDSVAPAFSALESAVAAAMAVLEDPRLRHGPRFEFDSARREAARNSLDTRKQAIAEACNAIESTMKVLCEERLTTLPSPPTARRLYDALVSARIVRREHEGLLLGPASFGNRRGRHGGGRTAHAVTEAEVELVVGQAAQAIVFLAAQLPDSQAP